MKYKREDLNNAIYFDRLAGFAYSRRCSILRKQYANGLISIDTWNDKRLELDHAYAKRVSQIDKEQIFCSLKIDLFFINAADTKPE